MNLLPLLVLMVFARGGGGAPEAKPATQAVRGKSGRAYIVSRVPSRTKRFHVLFQPPTPKGKKKPKPMTWEADFNGSKPVVATIRVSADATMIDDVMAFPPSVWA